MFKSGHVNVIVSDFEKALHFYADVLGLSLQHKVDGHVAQLEAPGLTIGLLHLGAGHGPQPGGAGNVSIGLEVETLEPVIETLKSRGVEFQHFTEEKATRLAHFSDPDGNPLYLIELR